MSQLKTGISLKYVELRTWLLSIFYHIWVTDTIPQLPGATKRLGIQSHKFWRVLTKVGNINVTFFSLPLEVFLGVPQVFKQELQKPEAAAIFNSEINTNSMNGTEYEYPS